MSEQEERSERAIVPGKMSRRHFVRSAAAGALGATTLGALAACGNSVRSQARAARGGAFTDEVVAQQVEVVADPNNQLRWTQPEYTANAGDVTFVVRNQSILPHQFAVEGNGVNAQSPVFQANTTNNYTLRNLRAGEYQLPCNYPGHREAGMVSKLTVRESAATPAARAN